MKALYQQKCIPCKGGADPMTAAEVSTYLKLVKDWTTQDQQKIIRTFVFQNFIQAIEFVNKLAKLAEQQGHHPDILIHSWNKVDVTLWTHVIKGLTINDFVLASKIDQILNGHTDKN